MSSNSAAAADADRQRQGRHHHSGTNANNGSSSNTTIATSRHSHSKKINTANNPYLRAHVERCIHRHRVVVFAPDEQCRLGQLLYRLFEEEGLKLFYVNDLPSRDEIAAILQTMAMAAAEVAEHDDDDDDDDEQQQREKQKAAKEIKRKGKPLHHYQTPGQQEDESRQPTLSPPSSPLEGRRRVRFAESVQIHITPSQQQQQQQQLQASPCHVFVHGRYHSLAAVRDIFLRRHGHGNTAKSRALGNLIEYCQRKRYLQQQLPMRLPPLLPTTSTTAANNYGGHRSHQSPHHQIPHHQPKHHQGHGPLSLSASYLPHSSSSSSGSSSNNNQSSSPSLTNNHNRHGSGQGRDDGQSQEKPKQSSQEKPKQSKD